MDKQEAKKRIRGMLCTQKLAVLATQGKNVPHTSLITFWAEDVDQIFFATSKNTRKFYNLIKSSTVSLLFDDRSSQQHLLEASAVTATGQAEVAGKQEPQARLFLNKNPQLQAFFGQSSTAFIRVRIAQYDLVTNFGNVCRVVL